MVSSNEQQVVVDFKLGGFNLTRVSTPNGTQQIVSVPKMASMLEAGAPDLPQFPVPAIIGDLAEMEVSVTKSNFTDYPDIEIAPSKGNFSRQIDPESVAYTYGEMYGKNAFYPAAQAYLETPYIIRDFRGQNIMVRPFAYNPMTKTLRVYHDMTIEMRKVSDNGVNQKSARKSTTKMSPEMKAAYNRRFINFKESTSKYAFEEDLGEMIVICPEQYMEAMQPFVDWKNQSGRPTTMVGLNEVGGNHDNQIKSYIQNIYNDPSRNLEFILLVGDYSDITPHSMSDGRSDNWFGQLEGSDFYLEALTGRFSVQNVTHVNTQVEKVLYYERDIKADVTWLNQGIGIAANEGAGNGHNGGEADYVHMNFIRDTLMHYTYENITQQYSGVGAGTSANAISADFNAGKSICNYCNHGSQTSWAVAGYNNSDVNALVNDNKWPYIWSVACNNGQFDGTCFGEAWLRATNGSTGRPTGAVGGMFSWISQPWVPPMTGQDEMNNILTGWKHSDHYNHTFGGASLNGSMYMLDMHPSDNGATHNTWILFGDPTLMVRTDNPTPLSVSYTPSVLLLGMSELEINTENTDYGIATLMMNDEVIASGQLDNGMCTLNFAPLENVGTATLTVIGYNKVTEVKSIDVLPAEGPFVVVSDHSPNLAPVNAGTSLSLSFKNVGVDPTSGITNVTLTCADPRLSFTHNTASFGVLDAEETITLQDAFSFVIAEGVEDGTRFQIDVEMTDGRQTWSGKCFITAVQAILEYVSTDWAEGFTPGETLTFAVNFKNIGHYMATNAIATIVCQSDMVTLLNPTVEMGTIDPEGIATCVFNVQIAESCPATSQIPVRFMLQADGDLSAEGSVTLKNVCYVVFELADSWGDGWNGASLTVSFDDGTPAVNLACQGNSQTEVLEIGKHTHVTLSWTRGSYDSECSFIVKYESNNQIIYQMSTYSSPSPGTMFEFECNCNEEDTGTLYPVENLTSEIGMGTVTLTWDEQDRALNYIISRNGIVIAHTEEPTYVDEVLTEYYYTYCVVAEYSHGNSVPECIIVKSELGLDENTSEFSIYPNPVNGTLFVNGGNTEYSYAMYNGMGQIVANGTAMGTAQINVDGLTKGVYFLRLTTGTQVLVEKVVVK